MVSIETLLNKWNNDPYNLLQILIEIEQHDHYISKDAIHNLSVQLAIPANEIIGVIEFYSFLHLQPTARYSFLFSDNFTDQLAGSRELAARLAENLGVEQSDNSSGIASVGFTSCTGMGDQAPALLIHGRPIPRLTTQTIDQISSLVKSETPLKQWPETLFEVHAGIKHTDRLLNTQLTAGAAIEAAITRGSDAIMDELDQSGLRGRGGAGFTTALKWRLCRDSKADQHYVVCNADEGEPGTFKDRLLLQQYADRVVEGMTACAITTGATEGFIYLRGEYRYLLDSLESLLEQRRMNGLLGQNILGHDGINFDIHIHLGAGAYICGEESALIESLEGKRGHPRNRPPFPVSHGYRGKPTVVNNVETFVAAAMITFHGAMWFNCCGTESSCGTKLLSISGDCDKPGIYEFPYGTSIKTILDHCGAKNTQAVQVAGAAGVTIPPAEFDRTIACEDIASGGSFMVINQERDLLQMVKNFCQFFVHESCGFCTPCRVGTTQINMLMEKIINGHGTHADIEVMQTIADSMNRMSHCGLGSTASKPFTETITKFGDLYEQRFKHTRFEPAFDLDASLSEARAITGRDDAKAHLKGGGV